MIIFNEFKDYGPVKHEGYVLQLNEKEGCNYHHYIRSMTAVFMSETIATFIGLIQACHVVFPDYSRPYYSFFDVSDGYYHELDRKTLSV